MGSTEEVRIFNGIYKDGGVEIPDLEDANTLLESGYGSLSSEKEKSMLKSYEALHLLLINRIEVIDSEDEEKLDFPNLFRKIREKDPDAWTRYLIYRDLRNRGYVVRDGFGFGFDFRVYDRGEYGKKPAKYIVYGVQEGTPLPIEKLKKILRFTQSIKRELVLGVIDRSGDMVYYSVSQLIFSPR